MTDHSAFFTRMDDGLFMPTGLGGNPWNGHSVGGVPLAGLVARVLEQEMGERPLHVARLTIDILGAVPQAPLEGAVSVLRDGRSVRLLGCDLKTGGRTWLRASALCVRMEDTPPVEGPPTRPFPEDAPFFDGGPMADVIRPLPEPRFHGRDAWWVRFRHPLVAGEDFTPFQRAAMLSDYGAGISALFTTREWTFANLDITLSMTRLPRGEWLLVDAEAQSAGNGVGLAVAKLSDRDGQFGTATQTVFLGKRQAG